MEEKIRGGNQAKSQKLKESEKNTQEELKRKWIKNAGGNWRESEVKINGKLTLKKLKNPEVKIIFKKKVKEKSKIANLKNQEIHHEKKVN